MLLKLLGQLVWNLQVLIDLFDDDDRKLPEVTFHLTTERGIRMAQNKFIENIWLEYHQDCLKRIYDPSW